MEKICVCYSSSDNIYPALMTASTIKEKNDEIKIYLLHTGEKNVSEVSDLADFKICDIISYKKEVEEVHHSLPALPLQHVNLLALFRVILSQFPDCTSNILFASDDIICLHNYNYDDLFNNKITVGWRTSTPISDILTLGQKEIISSKLNIGEKDFSISLPNFSFFFINPSILQQYALLSDIMGLINKIKDFDSNLLNISIILPLLLASHNIKISYLCQEYNLSTAFGSFYTNNVFNLSYNYFLKPWNIASAIHSNSLRIFKSLNIASYLYYCKIYHDLAKSKNFYSRLFKDSNFSFFDLYNGIYQCEIQYKRTIR